MARRGRRKQGAGMKNAAGPHVLNTLHELDQKIVVIFPAGGERHTTVPEYYGCDPVPARRRQRRIPPDLGVVVRVAVYPARRDQLTGGIHFLQALHRARFTDEGDLAVLDGDYGRGRNRERNRE